MFESKPLTIDHNLIVPTAAAIRVLLLEHMAQMVAMPAATPVAPAVWVTPLSGAAWHAASRPPRRIASLLLAPPIGIVRAVDRDSFPGDDDAAHAARIQVGVTPVDDRRGKPVGDPQAFLQLAR